MWLYTYSHWLIRLIYKYNYIIIGLHTFFNYREQFEEGLSFEVVAGEDAKPKEEEVQKNGNINY